MTATAPAFAQIPYPHDGPVLIGPRRHRFILGSMGLAAVASVLAFPFGLLLWLLPLVARLTAGRFLLIGPRYLLLGKQILYYANVQRVERSNEHGQLQLISDDGSVLVLARSKLSTNARKPEKIAANKAAKFDKVATLIIERIRLYAPGATLEER